MVGIELSHHVPLRTLRSPLTTASLESSGELLKLSWDEVRVGCLLGSGTFASVYLVENVLFSPPAISEDDPEDDSSTADATAVTTNFELGDSSRTVLSYSQRHYIALKCFQESDEQDENTRSKLTKLAAECLAKEAAILSSLPLHPNIIQLIGVSSNIEEDPLRGFLLLRRVSSTLDELLRRWKIRSVSSSFLEEESGWNPLSRIAKQKRERERLQEEQQSRVQQVGIGLSRAMAFLHSHKILYRDLKPENCGIDFEGQVRLFDFGFARTYNQDQDQDRLLTKFVGTARYMAPEVNGGSYGFPADVHSFAILLWQIVLLKKPFKHLKTIERLQQAVFNKHQRPQLRGVVSQDLRTLLKASWHPDPHMRPTFALITRQLEIEGSETQDEDAWCSTVSGAPHDEEDDCWSTVSV